MNQLIGLFDEVHVNELVKTLKENSMADNYTIIDRHSHGEELFIAAPVGMASSGAVGAVVEQPIAGNGLTPPYLDSVLGDYDLSDDARQFYARSVADGAYLVAVDAESEQIAWVRSMMEASQGQHIIAKDDDDTDRNNDHNNMDRANAEYATAHSNGSTATPRLLSASTMIGDAIVDSKGDPLGTLEEVMLRVSDGSIGYAVLAFEDGFLSNPFQANKLFAVPWSMMTLDTSRHCFILNVERERLEEAPGFDKDDWPDHAHPYWDSEVARYYAAF